MARTCRIGILDPVFWGSNETRSKAVQNSILQAQLAESLGYDRYWLAEHHGFRAYAGTNPDIMTAAILCATSRLKVGPAGILLPNLRAAKLKDTFETLLALGGDRLDFAVGLSDGCCTPEVAKQLAIQSAEPAQPLERISDFAVYYANRCQTDEPLWLLTSGGGSLSLGRALGLSLAYAHFINGAEWSPTLLRAAPRRALAIALAFGASRPEATRIAESWLAWRAATARCDLAVVPHAPPGHPLVHRASLVLATAETLASELHALLPGITDLIIMPLGATFAERAAALNGIVSALPTD